MSETWEVWDLIRQYGFDSDDQLYELLIGRIVGGQNLERALQCLNEMGEKGVRTTLKTVQGLIQLTCQLHQPRLALELALAFEETSVRRVDTKTWMSILIASSEAFYVSTAYISYCARFKLSHILVGRGHNSMGKDCNERRSYAR